MDNGGKMVTSDIDSSSSSDDEEEMKLESRAAELERQIVDNKYLYDIHLELVQLYRKLSDLKSLRAAYERFSETFPLTSLIWMEWIKDEIKLVTTAQEKEYVLSLFDRSVEDYLSVNLWLEYVQFCIGNYDIEHTYGVLEKALNAAGLHANGGSLLWDALRELELTRVSLYEPISEQWKEQIKRVVDAFRRQLAVPLLRMENTYSEWQEWLKQLPDDHGVDTSAVEWGYQKALKLLEVYKPFEDRLLIAEQEQDIVGIYEEYIDAVSDPATILCLYERGVNSLSLNVGLWNTYCLYTMKLGDVADKVSKRALRNCPWSEELWIVRVRILESVNSANEKIMECLEQGLEAILPSYGLNLWLSYLEYVRRTSESLEYLHKVFTQAAEQLGATGDPSCKVLRLQAHLYANQGNVGKARQLWSRIVKYSHYKSYAITWFEFLSLEKQYGDANHVRKLYERAIFACTDSPDWIIDEWLMYERQCGSLKEILHCEERCNQAIKTKANDNLTQENPTKSFEKRKHSYVTNARKKQKVNLKKIRIADIESEKAVFISNMNEQISDEKILELFPSALAVCTPPDKKRKTGYYAYVQFESEEEVEKTLKRDRELVDGRPLFISKCILGHTKREKTFKYSVESEKNKLFVRGLPINFKQKDVETLFEPYEPVDVRLVLHKSGRPKGLAYVDFNSEEKAAEALKATDQMDLNGHVITVAISAPPPKKDTSSTMTSNFPTRHGRSRLQLPLIPRNVQLPPPAASQEKTKTNDDFRKMLYKT